MFVRGTWIPALWLFTWTVVVTSQRSDEKFYGTKLGSFTNYAHGIGGTVYAVDPDTLFIKGFTYDGTGPDAFFWVGNTTQPSPRGWVVPYPENYKGSEVPILNRYQGENIILNLPKGIKIKDITWISVWCRRFTVNFGDLYIENSKIEIPQSVKLSEFSRKAHGVASGNVTILDERTFYIPELRYDGRAPDAFFFVGKGTTPNVETGIKVPNEKGSLERLGAYNDKDIEIQLPKEITVHDIDWLSIYCISYRENFGEVFVPDNLFVPPALGQTFITTTTTSALSNCLPLIDNVLQVRWALESNDIVVQLVGRIEPNQYMSFGLSGSPERSEMIGADVAVAYFDERGEPRVDDYFLSAKSQCDGTRGVCPDTRIGGSNDFHSVSGEYVGGVASITFRRSLRTSDVKMDQDIDATIRSQVIGAVGNLNNRGEANYHFSGWTAGPVSLSFSSVGFDGCPVPLSPDASNEAEKRTPKNLKPWEPQYIEGEDIITAQIGPTGGSRGYKAITGEESWGIAWWLNGKLIPEVYVERGKTYRFIVEGGKDETNPAEYHPFYITDSRYGGYGQLEAAERERETIYAGVSITNVKTDGTGYPYPTAVGRLCTWEPKMGERDQAENVDTFEEYKKSLELFCHGDGDPGELTWKVPMDAPDLLYYQCYNHQNMGWKIHVVSEGFRLRREKGPDNGAALSRSCNTISIAVISLLLCAVIGRWG